jgi:hypothetical protein
MDTMSYGIRSVHLSASSGEGRSLLYWGEFGMGFLSWLGLICGLIIAVCVPAGMLYLSGIGNELSDVAFVALTVGGSVVGLIIAGISMSLRTWSRY